MGEVIKLVDEMKQTAKMQFDERLLNTKQAADMLGLVPGTLNRARVYGTVGYPAYLKLGKAVRYKLSTLTRWMADQTEYTSTSQREVTK